MKTFESKSNHRRGPPRGCGRRSHSGHCRHRQRQQQQHFRAAYATPPSCTMSITVPPSAYHEPGNVYRATKLILRSALGVSVVNSKKKKSTNKSPSAACVRSVHSPAQSSSGLDVVVLGSTQLSFQTPTAPPSSIEVDSDYTKPDVSPPDYTPPVLRPVDLTNHFAGVEDTCDDSALFPHSPLVTRSRSDDCQFFFDSPKSSTCTENDRGDNDEISTPGRVGDIQMAVGPPPAVIDLSGDPDTDMDGERGQQLHVDVVDLTQDISSDDEDGETTTDDEDRSNDSSRPLDRIKAHCYRGGTWFVTIRWKDGTESEVGLDTVIENDKVSCKKYARAHGLFERWKRIHPTLSLVPSGDEASDDDGDAWIIGDNNGAEAGSAQQLSPNSFPREIRPHNKPGRITSREPIIQAIRLRPRTNNTVL